MFQVGYIRDGVFRLLHTKSRVFEHYVTSAAPRGNANTPLALKQTEVFVECFRALYGARQMRFICRSHYTLEFAGVYEERRRGPAERLSRNCLV